MCPSNHDLHTMYGIMQIANTWFRNDKNVKVDSSPTQENIINWETLLDFHMILK